MPRYPSFILLVPLFILALALSCTARPEPEAPEPVDESVLVVPPPYRIVLASPGEPAGSGGLPVGMVTALKLGSGRLNASSSSWRMIAGLAEDEAVRAVVMVEAPQGTAALFAELKDLRPDLLLVAVLPAESPLVIQATADFILDFDHVVRAYSAMLVTTRMGRSSIVSLTMPGATDDWRLNTRQAVLRLASRDMGLVFKSLAVNPDGLEKALRDLGGVPGVAIVVNDGRLAAEALRIASASGALFIELDRPADGYAGLAEGAGSSNGEAHIKSSGTAGGDPVRSLIDSARNVLGQPGLTLVWPGEQTSVLELGALGFARAILDGKPASEASLASVLNTLWPAGQWHAFHYVDPHSGVRARNHLVVSSDSYLVGRSYLSSESGTMPGRYRTVVW